VDFFAAATPCNPLGRFVLTHFAQNDKDLFVILGEAKYPRMVSFLLICVDFSPFCKRLKMTAVVWIFFCGYALQAAWSLRSQ